MAGFSITEFNSRFNGIVSTANFLVKMTTPSCLLNTDQGAKMSDLTFLCNTTTHPAIGIATQRVNRFGYAGSSYLVPYASLLEDTIMLDFYLRSSDVLPIKIFNYWIQQIVGVPNDMTLLSKNAGSLLMPGQVAYRSSYTSTLDIISYDYNSSQLIKTTLTGVYPTRIGELQVSWNEGDIARLQVGMSYTGIKVRAEVLEDGEQPINSSIRGSTDPEAYQTAARAKDDKNIELTSYLDRMIGVNSSVGLQQFFNSSVSDQLNRLYNVGNVPGNIQSQGIPI